MNGYNGSSGWQDPQREQPQEPQPRRYAVPQMEDEPAPRPQRTPRIKAGADGSAPQKKYTAPPAGKEPSGKRRSQGRYAVPQAPARRQPRVKTLRTARPQQPRKRGKIVWYRLALLILCIGVMIYAGTQLILYFADSINTSRNNAELQALYAASKEEAQGATPTPSAVPTPTPTPTPRPTQAPAWAAHTPVPTATPVPSMRTDFQYLGQTTREEMQELWKINHDLVAWLNIPGVVDLPVVYRDNDYYLHRDFYKKRSNGGTLFLDVHHPLRPENQYLVVHGHNMKDGSMFGLLAHYADREYARKHPTVYWNTLYREEVYKVYAVLIVPTDVTDPRFVPYLGTPKFSSPEHFNAFIAQIRRNAKYITDERVGPNDALMTLSTCLDDDRIVVLCKRTSH